MYREKEERKREVEREKERNRNTSHTLHLVQEQHTFATLLHTHLLQAASSALHSADGIQRFEEPVSKITVNVCPGDPMLISP